MAGKDFVNPVTLMAAGDMSGDLTSDTVTYMGFDNIGFQFIFTGTPNGNFYVDISLDQVAWTTLPLSPAPVASGAAGNNYVELNQSTAKYARCRYDRTSGSGVLKIIVIQKMV
jgi:hypothetical protein